MTFRMTGARRVIAALIAAAAVALTIVATSVWSGSASGAGRATHGKAFGRSTSAQAPPSE